MNKSENINELAAALAKAQGAMTAAKMDATNPFLKNKYADLGSVIQAAKTPLAANGLSYTQHPSLEAGAVTVTTILMHASGQWIESAITLPFGEIKGLSLAQSMGIVITYMRRYTLSSILGIYADEDTDGNEGEKKTPVKQAAPAPAKEEPIPVAITAEEAAEVTSSAGKRYGDMTKEELSGMSIRISNKLRSETMPREERAQYNRKLAAIEVLLSNMAK